MKRILKTETQQFQACKRIAIKAVRTIGKELRKYRLTKTERNVFSLAILVMLSEVTKSYFSARRKKR